MKLVGAQQFADSEVVSAVILQFRSTAYQLSGLANDGLMSVHQTRKLNRDLFLTGRRPFDSRRLGQNRRRLTPPSNWMRSAIESTQPARRDAYVKKMGLVERRSPNLPVRLLVQIAESHGIGKELIQLFGHLQPYGFLDEICPVLWACTAEPWAAKTKAVVTRMKNRLFAKRQNQ